MIPPVDDLIGLFFKFLLGGAVSLLFWGKRKDKEKLDEHSTAIVELKTLLVTEDKVRAIIKDEINPVRDDMREIKNMVRTNSQVLSDLTYKIAEQEGYKRATDDIKAHITLSEA